MEKLYAYVACLTQALSDLDGGATDPGSVLRAQLRCAAILGLN
jgi:hypothetical protein